MATAVHKSVMEIASGSLSVADGRVDEEAGIIRRVKVLGFHSRNYARTIGLTHNEFGEAVNQPYSYSRQAMEQALSLYEGAKVFSNHTEFGYDEESGKRIIVGTDRDNSDLIGWLESVAIEGDGSKGTDGLYADLHVVKSHAMAKPLFEIAQRRPQLVALSHEAHWNDPILQGGHVVLNEITHVECVALVSGQPGTNAGLFESGPINTNPRKSNMGTPVKTTIKKIVESVARKTEGRKRLLELVEDDRFAEEMADVPVEVAPDASPEDQIKAGIVAAIIAKINAATPEQLEAVLTALGMGDSLSGAAAGKSAVAAEEEAEPTADDKEKLPVAESKKPDRGGLILECVGVLRDCGVSEYHETILEAMANLPTKEKRLAFARSQKTIAAEAIPRSQAPGPAVEIKAKADGVDYSASPGLATKALRGA